MPVPVCILTGTSCHAPGSTVCDVQYEQLLLYRSRAGKKMKEHKNILSKLLPFIVTNGKGNFGDFANREQLNRLQEQKGVSLPCCPKDKRFKRAVNAGWRNSTTVTT